MRVQKTGLLRVFYAWLRLEEAAPLVSSESWLRLEEAAPLVSSESWLRLAEAAPLLLLRSLAMTTGWGISLLAMTVGIPLSFLPDLSPAFAADQPVSVQRIGVVNLDRILQEYKRTKISDQKLGEIYKSKQAEREKLVAEIKNMKEELVLLNEQSRQERQQAVDQKLKGLSEFDKTSVDSLQKEREQAINEILKEVEETVSSYAKEKGFDLILSSRAVLYELQAMDLTDEILRVLNGRYGKKGGP